MSMHPAAIADEQLRAGAGVFSQTADGDAVTQPADEDIVIERKFTSGTMAAFWALMRALDLQGQCALIKSDPDGKEIELNPAEVARTYQSIIEMGLAAESRPESQGRRPSAQRRYYMPAWMAEAHRRGETLPYVDKKNGPPEEIKERGKAEARLARAWWRHLREVHTLQCYTQLRLLWPEARTDSTRHEARWYVDHITDLVWRIRRKADGLRRGLLTTRYNRAAVEVLAEFRQEVALYAPEFKPADPPTINDVPGTESETETLEDFFEAALKMAGKAARALKAKVQAKGLSEDEAIAFRARWQAEFETAWTDEPPPAGTPRPRSRAVASTARVSVLKNARHDSSAAPSAPQLCAPEARFVATPVSLPNPPDLPLSAENLAIMPQADPDQVAAPVDDGTRTLLACQSVGVGRGLMVYLSAVTLGGDYRLTGTDRRSLAQMLPRVATYIARSEARSESVSLRLFKGEPVVQVDDCDATAHARLLPFSFFAAETSPGNFQNWLALPPDLTQTQRDEIKERLLRQLNPTHDPKLPNGGAHGAIRLPGSLNCKEKYRERFGAYPRVRLTHAHMGRVVSPLELEHAGLLAAPKLKPVPVSVPGNTKLPTGAWPDYHHYLATSPRNADGGDDRSKADIRFAMACLGAGFPRHAVEAQLESLSTKAQGRRDGYAATTVDHALQFIAEDNARKGGKVTVTL
ncbi:MAG: DNA-primase RepB domain-containing protein [Pyrinomonadaceae bacterium]